MFKDLGKVSKDEDSFYDCSTDSCLLSIVKQNTSYFTGLKHYWHLSVYILSTSGHESISKFLDFFFFEICTSVYLSLCFMLQCSFLPLTFGLLFH